MYVLTQILCGGLLKKKVLLYNVTVAFVNCLVVANPFDLLGTYPPTIFTISGNFRVIFKWFILFSAKTA